MKFLLLYDRDYYYMIVIIITFSSLKVVSSKNQVFWNKKFFYDFKTRRVHSVRSNVANAIRFALFVGSDFFDSIGRVRRICQIFDIRIALLRDVGFSTFDGGQYWIENRIESYCTPLFKVVRSQKLDLRQK